MTYTLHNRRILLIISGGIAAYKSLDLIRRLRDGGASVRCILSNGGAEFITPLAVSALSGQPAVTDLWAADEPMGHIHLSRQADLVLVAPATANIMAKMAHGLADDLASATLLACDKPIFVAPAMNPEMWANDATQENLARLEKRGITRLGPASGDMACGEVGEGRMMDVAEIVAAVTAHFAKPGHLSGKRVLVTSGPTREPIDPVRYISNRSSGKQGHAIAEALRDLGADVTLISGPVELPDPVGLRTLHVETARDMLTACESALPADIAICAAAVADWRVTEEATHKIKKQAGENTPTFSFIENPDILATLSKPTAQRPRLVIGFAAETNDVATNAEAKFKRKGCDWLVANKVGTNETFGTNDNQVTLYHHDPAGGIISDPWPRMDKIDVARQLAHQIALHFKTA